MFRIVYTSVRKHGLSRHEIGAMCEKAALNNRGLGIHGLLLCNEREFMQYLEGTKEAVTTVYNKIIQDSRHSDIRLLICEPSDKMLFSNWSMVCLALRPQEDVNNEPSAFDLLDHRLYRPWKSLGCGAVDLIYEYAKIKSELEKWGEVALLDKIFEVYQI